MNGGGQAGVEKLRVVLADDHPIFRAGLRGLIDAQPDLLVVAEASDGAEAVRCVLDHTPEVAVLDVTMPMISGPGVAERISELSPATRMLAMSGYEDAAHVRSMLAAGARGYVSKRSPPGDILRAIRAVAAGELYLAPIVAATVLERHPDPGRKIAALSDREAEVLRRIVLGHSMKEIAAQMDVAVRTVETYRARAMEKLSLESRADIVRYALERGWLDRGA